MIAGDEKLSQIEAWDSSAGELLRYYFRFFSTAVGRNTTVLVIGYSFSDPRINRVLAKEGVRLVVVDPAGLPQKLAGGRVAAEGIRRNLIGLWPMRYVDIFGTSAQAHQNQRMTADLTKRLGL